jgi:hypothetical protein
MSPLCPILRPSFEDYRRDTLPAPQRRILRDHLAVCDECRALAVSEDSSMLFARPFPAEPVSEDDAKRILGNVRTAVAFARTERRIRRSSRRRIAGAAAAAAAFGALLLMAPGGGTDRVETLRIAALPGGEARPTPAPVEAESEAVVPAADLLPEIEGVSNDATVYEWSPGAGREEPRVVWIVDRGLDI